MDEQLLAALKALADASRLTIVGLLAKKPRSVDELAAALGLSAPTVSHHLSKLAQAGLVEMRSEQYYSVYSLKPEALDSIGKRVIGADQDAALTTLTDEAAYARGVIKDYVRESGMACWTGGLKKQRVLLNWVGDTKFQRGMRYDERQVEDILGQSIYGSPDTNSMRRYMISEKVLARVSNGSWYWRADTPEAQRPSFSFEQLHPAEHEFSPEDIARQLKSKSRLSLTRAALDTHMRNLGVHNIDDMRTRMIRLELLSASDDGATWTITDPNKVMGLRSLAVKKRFMVDGKIPALPSDLADRLLVLRWFADHLDRHRVYTDKMLANLWRRLFADVPTLKNLLLAEGLLVPAKGDSVVRHDSVLGL